jgi:hypothetical protein
LPVLIGCAWRARVPLRRITAWPALTLSSLTRADFLLSNGRDAAGPNHGMCHPATAAWPRAP